MYLCVCSIISASPDMTPCRLSYRYQRRKGSCRLHFQGNRKSRLGSLRAYFSWTNWRCRQQGAPKRWYVHINTQGAIYRCETVDSDVYVSFRKPLVIAMKLVIWRSKLILREHSCLEFDAILSSWLIGHIQTLINTTTKYKFICLSNTPAYVCVSRTLFTELNSVRLITHDILPQHQINITK